MRGQVTPLTGQVPENAIRGWIDAELRSYPNLIVHVFDAMHGIWQRPTGCAEQITSADAGWLALSES
jgi:hypothetical protein